MLTSRKKPEETVPVIEMWLKDRVKDARCKGGILGLSGGIDSAVAAVLLRRAFGKSMLTVKMPCHSLPVDGQHADLMVKTFDLPCITVDLSDTYDSLIQALGTDGEALARANIKPRLRMTALYALAQENNYLVCGTSNRAELTVGYFTKHGDSGTDLLPLGDLTKTEVREMAVFLGVPKVIVEKPPSAGLWEGQTDEDEMGISYDDIDRYILGDEECGSRNKIKSRFLTTSHKREMAPVCRLFK